MNLLLGSAGYVLTGSWARKAHAEAAHRGDARVLWDGAETGYTAVPRSLDGLADGLDYLHVTSNETIEGVEFPPGFEPADGPALVCDASSDLLSQPIPIERYGLLYAGAQKNAGPAGLTIVVLRDEVGGLEAMAERNREKASLLYDEIDGSGGFYRGRAAASSRSRMNVTFRLPEEAMEKEFVSRAAAEGMVELAGHRSVGGVRASIYNAVPLEAVRTLRSFMERFRAATP